MAGLGAFFTVRVLASVLTPAPTGGGVRHGSDIANAAEMPRGDAKLYCNLIRSYLGYLLAEHDRNRSLGCFFGVCAGLGIAQDKLLQGIGEHESWWFLRKRELIPTLACCMQISSVHTAAFLV
ncbi:hypothetical protein, partial [Acetobacter indonesiensis]